MAALRTVDISGGLFTAQNVWSKPPRPQSAGKFHNRGSGKLFPSTHQKEIFTETIKTDTYERSLNSPASSDASLQLQFNSLSVSDQNQQAESTQQSNHSQPCSPKRGPNYRRRTQSAKAKISKPSSARVRPKSASYVRPSKAEIPEKNMPVIDLCDRIAPDLTDIEREKILTQCDHRRFSVSAYQDLPPMHFSNPSNFDLYQDISEKGYCRQEKTLKKKKKAASSLEPSVYGLQRQRQVFGSAPDLTAANTHFQQFPYRFSKKDDNSCYDDVIEDNVGNRSIPLTLNPLLPWLCDEVPEDVTGVDPTTCLIFLPETDWSHLPEVPTEPLEPDTDLPFIKDVTTPRPWNPKKHAHPFNKQPVDEWICRHTTPADATGADIPLYRQRRRKKSRVRMPRMRTAEVVRQEISDLENLLKGVGRQNSECGLSKYQSEIDEFQDMFRITMDMVPDRLKNPEKPPDTFGLKKFCEEHDLIISNIRSRMEQCRDELASLEVEAGIETDRRYFRTRSNSVV